MEPLPGIYCPVCHSNQIIHWSDAKDYEYFTSDKIYSYYRCRSCDTLFINPVPVNELPVIYPQNYYSFSPEKKGWAFTVKEYLELGYFKKILKQVPGERINVLDVGGGTGWLLNNLKKGDKRIQITQVVDINKEAGIIATRNGHLYFQGRIEDFVSDTKFHLVLMLNLVEHVADPKKVLKNIGMLLDEEGIVILKTPNNRSADARLFRSSYWGGLHCPRHWVLFSEKSFRIMVSHTGLCVKKLTFTQGGPFWAFSLIISLAKRGILKTNRERPVIFHPLFSVISAFFAGIDYIRSPFSRTSQMFIQLVKKTEAPQ